MGIPVYLSYIIKQHPDIVQEIGSIEDHIQDLFIDANSIIYDAVHQGATTDTEVYDGVARLLEELCSKVQPTRKMYVMFDGVAPAAKMDQQRTRRFKSAFEKRLVTEDAKSAGWDTTAITPGTVFMVNLKKELTARLKSSGLSVLVEISGPDEPQEGEHKIFSLIRDPLRVSRSDIVAVYGLDADLIMLALNHLSVCPKTYLFRETPHFVSSLSRELKPNTTYLLNIPELSKSIAVDFGAESFGGQVMNEAQYVSDYILLCFLLGNDFMPHFPSINIRQTGIRTLIDAYKEMRATVGGRLVEDGQIAWKRMRALVSILSQNERERFLESDSKRAKQARYCLTTPKFENDNPAIDLPLLDRSVEIFIDPSRDGWTTRYYQSLFNCEDDKARVRSICTEYVKAMEWTFKYYNTGCVDWRWRYPYAYAPLLTDLAQYIPYLGVSMFPDVAENGPVSPVTQLAYVLPGSALWLLPQETQAKLYTHLRANYRDDFDFEWAYCRYFWECHVKFPDVALDRIEEVLA